MEEMVRFSVSMPEDLAREFDRWVEEKKLRNRSDALRQIIRSYIGQAMWETQEGEAYGTFTFSYDHHSKDSSREIMRLQHDFGKGKDSASILERISAWSKDRLCAVHCGSLPWIEGKHLVNRAFFVGEDGTAVSFYDKAHLIPMMNENSFFKPGDGASLFLWKGLVCGNAICYDIRFPEFIRGIALAGARILLVPAAWPESRIGHWRTLLQARAIENQVFVIACNRNGLSGEILFGGHSMAIAPDGTILAEAGAGDETLLVEIDPLEVDRVRKSFPVLDSRRRGLYSIVSSI